MPVDDACKKVLDKYADLFKELASKDNLEYDMTQYILLHKDGLKSKIDTLFPVNETLNELKSLQKEQREENILRFLRDELSYTFNLNSEELLARLDRNFIKTIAKELLE